MQKLPELTAKSTCSLAPAAAFHHLSFRVGVAGLLAPFHTHLASGNAVKAPRGLARRSRRPCCGRKGLG